MAEARIANQILGAHNWEFPPPSIQEHKLNKKFNLKLGFVNKILIYWPISYSMLPQVQLHVVSILSIYTAQCSGKA